MSPSPPRTAPRRSIFSINEQGAFDLLLTDIQMPVMDGIALALAAARDFPDLTILLMTGFAAQRERASGLDAIVHDVITKPFSVNGIRAAVAGALAARKTRLAPAAGNACRKSQAAYVTRHGRKPSKDVPRPLDL